MSMWHRKSKRPDPSRIADSPESCAHVRQQDETHQGSIAEVLGHLGSMMNRGEPTPEYVARIPADLLVVDVYNSLDRFAGRVDHEAHVRGESFTKPHSELEFIATALTKLARGEPVEANPYFLERATDAEAVEIADPEQLGSDAPRLLPSSSE